MLPAAVIVLSYFLLLSRAYISNMAALPNKNELLDVLYAAFEVQMHARRENKPWPLQDLGKMVAEMMGDWATRPYAFHEAARCLCDGTSEFFDSAGNLINRRPSATELACVRLLSVLDKVRNGRQGS
jgi:hypothetical protein